MGYTGRKKRLKEFDWFTAKWDVSEQAWWITVLKANISPTLACKLQRCELSRSHTTPSICTLSKPKHEKMNKLGAHEQQERAVYGRQQHCLNFLWNFSNKGSEVSSAWHSFYFQSKSLSCEARRRTWIWIPQPILARW